MVPLCDSTEARLLPLAQADVLVPSETEAPALIAGDQARDLHPGGLAGAMTVQLACPPLWLL